MPLQHSPDDSHLPCPGPLTSATHTSFSCIISEWVLEPFDSFKFGITNDSIISLRVYIQPIEFLVHLHFLYPSEQLLKICNDPSNSSCLASLRPENHRPERAHVESGLCHLWAQNLLRASYLPQNGNKVLEMIHKALWVPGVSLWPLFVSPHQPHSTPLQHTKPTQDSEPLPALYSLPGIHPPTLHAQKHALLSASCLIFLMALLKCHYSE